jgi:hypothetical protein
MARRRREKGRRSEEDEKETDQEQMGEPKTRRKRKPRRGLGRKKCELGGVATNENMNVVVMRLFNLSIYILPEAITACTDLIDDQSRNMALRISLYISK